MKIAIVGAGVSGLVAAHRLTLQGHHVSVFEASGRCGGHARSVSLESEGVQEPIEAGFLVFNEATSPRLTSLLAELDTPTRELHIEFEIRYPQSEMVLRGGSLRELLANPMNLTVPSFYRIVPDYIRFTRQTRKLLDAQGESPGTTIGEFLHNGAYSDAFVVQFVYPLVEAVYPQRRESLAQTPLVSLLGFIQNHALLKSARGQSCRTLTGGSRGYLHRLADRFRDRIHLNCPVAAIVRQDDCVLLKFLKRSRERFDRVVLAVHADVALRLLADPTRNERKVLQAFEYAPQDVYIHTADVQSGRSPASAIWRFQPSMSGRGGVALSYCISEVQGVDAPAQLMLTMSGAGHPPPAGVVRTINFRRPVFSAKSLLAQRRFTEINGRHRTHFCGSYWGHGFHEDAVRTAQDVAQQLA